MALYTSIRTDGNRVGYKPIVAGSNVSITETNTDVVFGSS